MKTIQLINYEMGYGTPPVRVQGYSGATYATSRFDSQHGCHVAKITVAEYNKAAKDLSRAWHLSMRRWVPMIPEAESIAAAPIVELPAPPEEPAEPLQLFEEAPAQPDQPAPLRDVLMATHISTLKKMARDRNIAMEATATKEEIVSALLAHTE